MIRMKATGYVYSYLRNTLTVTSIFSPLKYDYGVFTGSLNSKFIDFDLVKYSNGGEIALLTN